MRTLSGTLTAAQKSHNITPAIKVVLTKDETEYTLEEDRILSINHIEEPDHINAKGTLFHNADGYFTDKDLKGFKAVASYGLDTGAGKEYSATSPMWVTWQQLDSAPGKLTCELTLLGIPDLMDLDEASASYIPDSTDTKTVKTLLREIAGDSGVTHLACFNHTQKYDMVFDSEDDLIDVYQPKDSFRIYTGGSRWAAFRRLLSYTGCVQRIGNDGKIHIIIASGGSLAGWSNKLAIKIDHTKVDSDLTHFGVLIKLGESVGQNSSDVTRVFDELGENYLKIAVTEGDGVSQLYVEVEKWDATNEVAWLWVSKAGWEISSTKDTNLYLYYDASHADNTSYVGLSGSPVAENVWDSSYVLVDHMRDDPDASHTRDSTSNDNDGEKTSANNPLEAAGKVGQGQSYDGSGQAITISPFVATPIEFTVEALFKRLVDTGTYQTVVRGINGNGYSAGNNLYVTTTAVLIQSGGQTQTKVISNFSDWLYVGGIHDSDDNICAFLNGTISSAKAAGAIATSTHDTLIGRVDSYKPNAILDEVRISNVARSAAWIKASYYSTIDDFLSFDTEAYDYEYNLESGHVFLSKAYRKSLVLPNYIVIQSKPDDDPQYSGYASDTDSYALMPKRKYYMTRLQSNAQATAIAEAMLANYKLNAEMGAATVPMNCGAELYDYVKVTDQREDDYRVGNLGSITRVYKPGQYSMSFTFGEPPIIRHTRELYRNITTQNGLDFERLRVGDFYAEHIQADNIDLVWMDVDGNIDLSQIGDNIDNLPDGTTYARIKSLHLDAGQIKLDSAVYYADGYNPTEKEYQIKKQATAPSSPSTDDLWLDTSVTPNVLKRWNGSAWVKADPADLDDMPDGSTYKRLLSTQIQAGKILLSDQCVYTSGYDPTEKEVGVHRGTSPPGDTNKLWLDTSVIPNVWKRYTGADWVKCTPTEAAEITNAFDKSADNLDNVPNGTTYSRVKTTAIEAGLIKLSDVVEYSTHRTVSDTEKSSWTSKPENMDQIGEGTTYKRTLATDISAGHIKLTSAVVVEGQWYDESGVIISATEGIKIDGQKIYFRDSGQTERGRIYGDITGSNLKIKGVGNIDIIAQGGTPNIGIGGNLNPIGTQKIGNSTAFAEIHGTSVYATGHLHVPAVP